MHRPFLALALTLPLAAPALAAEPLRVLATVGMVGDIAARVGGTCVTVETLIGAGADPHLFTPAPSDLRALQSAETILYGGLNLEGQLGEVLERLGQTRPVVAVSEASVPEDLRLAEDGGAADPHVWMDPSLWARTAPVLAETFAAARPDCGAEFGENAALLQAELAALDTWARLSLATVATRDLVTAHDAFAYFGRAYDLEVTAIQGISTLSEAAIADIDAVAALVADRGVPAVFVESTINPRTIEALREAVGARGGSVALGGELFADALGAPGSGADTYVGMIRHNVETITRALGGTPAPWPDAITGGGAAP
jgi:manganese/zinc/iron transport system substrate-binding protein